MGAAAGRDPGFERRPRRPPCAQILPAELLDQRVQRGAGVADQPHGLVVAADLLAVDVDVDIGGRRGIELPRIGAVLVHPRADQQDDVGLGDQVAIVAGPAAPAHDVAGDADRQRMRFVRGALAHAGGDDGQRGRLLQACQRPGGVGAVDAAAGDDQGLPRGCQRVGRLANRLAIGARPIERKPPERGQASRADRRRGDGIQRLLEHVHRAEQDGRAGAAAGGRGEGHVDIVGDARQVVDPADPFGAAGKEGDLVQLLEGIAVALRPMDLLHDRDHGNRCLERLGEPGHEKGGGRPVLRGDHRHLVGDAGIGVGHRRAGILRAIADLADAELGRDEMQQGRDALAEHHRRAVPAQRLEEEMRAAAIGVAVTIARQAGRPGRR